MGENIYHRVRVLAWQALAYYQMGDKARAFSALNQAFIIAETQGRVRSFFVAGRAFALLL